jgi:hypothetical protein
MEVPEALSFREASSAERRGRSCGHRHPCGDVPRGSMEAEVVPAKNRDARTKASQRELRDLSVQNRL